MATYAYTFTSGDTVTPTKLNNARTITDIVNADIKGDAAIVGTKVSPNFGSQDVVTTGSMATGTTTPSAQLHITKAETTAYNGAATDGQVGAGATALIQQTAGSNTAVAQIVFQPRGSQPFNRIASSGGSAPFMAFTTNNEERLRVTSSGQMLVNTAAALPIGSTGTGVQIAETGLQLSRWNSASATAPAFIYAGRSKSATIGTNSAVADNDELFRIGCYGADGTTFVEAAKISAFVDGTPGTGDMPGRITFSTTSNGSATATERMRITSDGTLSVNSTSPPAGSLLHVAGKVTATSFGDVTSTDGLVASVTDGSAIVRSSRASTDVNGPQMDMRKARGTQAAKTVVASGDILGELRFLGYGGTADHEGARIRAAVDGTPGNNDMPTMLQFYTTADGASAPSERMRIDNGGNVVIGKQSAESRLNIAAISNATTNYPLRVDNSSNNYGAGYGAYGLSNRVNAGNLSVDYTVDVGGTFLLNTDGSEKLRLGTNGNLGLGSTSITNSRLRIGGQIAGSTSAHGVYLDPVVQPAVTSSVAAVRTFIATAANGGTAYTTTTLSHFWADQGTLHADSTVTNQYGFFADSGLTGATNNFGFRSEIASGTGRWNFYANGTASNYFAGTVAVGTTSPNSAALLDVSSTTRGFLPPRMTTAQRDAITSPPAGLLIYNTTTNKLNVRAASAWEAVTSA